MSSEVAPAEVEEAHNLPVIQAHEAIVARGEISVEEAKAQKDKIVALMTAVMVEGIHYGLIPGISKPSLFKPGAEAINVALRLAPDYESVETYDGDHLTVKAKCKLSHIPTGLFVAAGEGLCSSKETKYAWRKSKRSCPECGAEAIIKGKAEYGGGWVCWKKAEPVAGCGANYADDDPRITGQVEGKVVNPDLPDTWNTVLKMADKRALIAAVLNGTAASDVFTQDVEDSQAAREQAEREGRREDRPAYPVPTSWKKIEEGVRACDNGEEAWALFQAFTRAASYFMFGPEPDMKKLKKDERDILYKKAAGATVWLHENVDWEGPFLYFDEAHMRSAWASVMEGELLEIPDYEPPPKPEDEDLAAEDVADQPY